MDHELGADVVLHSITKYLGGHSDLIGWAPVANDPELRHRVADRSPGPMTHASVSGSPIEVPETLIRLSVGIEHPDDLVADLDQALG